jgi:hypothetical protein
MVDEGIDLADLFEIPEGGELNPFPVKIRHRVKRPIKCSHCRQEGHNRRTCPNRIYRPVQNPNQMKRKIRNPVIENPLNQCKCGNIGSPSCFTNSCKNCCRSPNCKRHGDLLGDLWRYQNNRRIEPRQNNLRNVRRQNPIREKTYSLFGNILSSLPNIFGGLILLSVIGLILGSTYIAFNALLPVFEEIWAFLEFLWEGVVSIVNFVVAVANFIGSVFEFIFSILNFIYEIIEFIVLIFVAIIALVVWLIVGILTYAGELLAWIF